MFSVMRENVRALLMRLFRIGEGAFFMFGEDFAL